MTLCMILTLGLRLRPGYPELFSARGSDQLEPQKHASTISASMRVKRFAMRKSKMRIYIVHYVTKHFKSKHLRPLMGRFSKGWHACNTPLSFS